MQAVIRGVRRSLSPFRRRKSVRQLIEDVELKEQELMTELSQQKKSNLAAIEVMLDEDESNPPEYKKMEQKILKRIAATQQMKKSIKKANGDSDTATPATASTTQESPNGKEQRAGSPSRQLRRQQTFRQRFKRVRSLKRHHREAECLLPPEIPRTVTSRGRSRTKRDNRDDSVFHEESNWLPPICLPSSASVAVASSIGAGTVDRDDDDELSQPSKVSELSTPVALQRAESLGNESIAEIRGVLQTMERRLSLAERTGSRVSRAQVIKELMKVADSVDSLEEREAMYTQMVAMVNRQPPRPRETHSPDLSSIVDQNDDETLEESSESSGDSEGDETNSQSSLTIPDEPSPFGEFFASIGNFFSSSSSSPPIKNEKDEAKEVLDDLLSFEKSRRPRDRRDEQEEAEFQRRNNRHRRSNTWGDNNAWEMSSWASELDQSASFGFQPPDKTSRALARLRSQTGSPSTEPPARRKLDSEFNFMDPRFRSNRSARPASPNSDGDSGATPANAHERFNLERLPSFNWASSARRRSWRQNPL